MAQQQLEYTAFTIRKDDNLYPEKIAEVYTPIGHRAQIQTTCMLASLKAFSQVKVLVCVTMYNESEQELRRTMRGVMRDALTMKRRGVLKDLDKEFVAILLADGLDRVNREFLQNMTDLKCYNEDILAHKGYITWHEFSSRKGIKENLYKTLKESQRRENNVVHCFQKKNMKDFNFTHKDQTDLAGKEGWYNLQGINFIFAIKHHNAGKLNSHLFLFRGFCEYLKPKYTVLLDIGTETVGGATCRLINVLEVNQSIGGMCGSIEVDLNKMCYSSLMEAIVLYSQYYEYKISNYLDKAAENLFGFISVLPGAFSVYRNSAIQGKPLREYFRGLQEITNTPFMSNMYLAEDRIMCFQIIGKRTQKNTLAYLPQAKAITDCPRALDILIKQRRRWINGANFAQFYVIKRFMRIWRTKHKCCTKMWITLFYFYYLMNTFLNFLIVGILYFSYSIVLRDFFGRQGFDLTIDNPGQVNQHNTPLVIFFESFYLFLIVWTMLLSLSVNIETAELQVKIVSISFGLLMLLFIFLAYFYFFFKLKDLDPETQGASKMIILISMGIVVMSQTLPVILYCKCNPIKLFLGFFAYLFMVPTYTNMFTIYSFCNTHDVSWGTRQRNMKNVSAAIAGKIDSYKKFRFHVLWIWIAINLMGAYLMASLVRRGVANSALIVFASFLAFTLVFRLIASIISRCCVMRIIRDREIPTPIKLWEEPQLPPTPKVSDLIEDDYKMGSFIIEQSMNGNSHV